ncbi:MAG: hypothetical protein JXA60_10410 [Candidatus Coatesbacteria bacterium]|nr:hypothetical protein [Candidatus Coatesbacteria bacterium]
MESDDKHYNALIDWIGKAYRNTPMNLAFPAGYNLEQGWLKGKETTAALALVFFLKINEERFIEVAKSLADYLVSRQVPVGWYFPSDKKPPVNPSIYTTAVIIDALLKAYSKFNDEAYIESAINAGNWLISIQASDGTWRRFSPHGRPQSFHAIAASKLAKLYEVTLETGFKLGAIKYMEWLKSMYEPRIPWIYHMERKEGISTKTRDMALTLLGMVEIAEQLSLHDIMARASDFAEKILEVYREKSFLYPAYSIEWKPEVKSYADILGYAYMARTFLNLDKLKQCVAFGGIARSMIQYIKKTHVIEGKEDFVGALKLSQPIHKGEKPLTFSSDATIVFADLLYDAKTDLLPKWDRNPEKK